LLREAQAKEEEEEDAKLEALLMEGFTSGEDVSLSREFWRELKAEAAELARKHKKNREAPHVPVTKLTYRCPFSCDAF
jgi:antitoxin ParD1/3/4